MEDILIRGFTVMDRRCHRFQIVIQARIDNVRGSRVECVVTSDLENNPISTTALRVDRFRKEPVEEPGLEVVMLVNAWSRIDCDLATLVKDPMLRLAAGRESCPFV